MSCQTLRTLLRGCLAASTVQTLPGCRSTLSPTYQEAPRDGVTIYLIAASWHTEIALPIDTIHDPLRTVTPDFPGAQYLSFGWGERNYYMARAPTLRPALSPGASSMPLQGPVSASYTCNTWTAEGLRLGGVPVTPAGVVFVSQPTDQLRR